MWLHRFFILVLLIMAFYTLNLDWFHHSYNLDTINPYGIMTPPSKVFWGDLFLYGSGFSYTLLALFVIFIPQRLFITTVVFRIWLLIIALQMIFGLIIIAVQSNAFSMASINVMFILFLMVNLALIRRVLSFWSATASNNKYAAENILD